MRRLNPDSGSAVLHKATRARYGGPGSLRCCERHGGSPWRDQSRMALSVSETTRAPRKFLAARVSANKVKLRNGGRGAKRSEKRDAAPWGPPT